jgi:hypothetical protein
MGLYDLVFDVATTELCNKSTNDKLVFKESTFVPGGAPDTEPVNKFPIVWKTTNFQINRKGVNDRIVYKDGTYTLNQDGVNPRIMLQWSDDGGYTWSNEYWVSVGKQGQYRALVNFCRLGMSRDRVFRVTVTDPVKWVFVGATIDASKETK